MEGVRKAINIIGSLLASVGFLGLFVSGGWQDDFFPGFFVMAGCCVSLFFLGVWLSNVEFRQTRKKHRRTNG